MRLIDADENRESFKKIVYCVLKNDFLTSKDKFNQIMIAFDSISTAYDIDKVVEELKKSSKWVNETNEYGDDDGNDYIPLSKAIEIVKQGGVADCISELENLEARR